MGNTTKLVCLATWKEDFYSALVFKVKTQTYKQHNNSILANKIVTPFVTPFTLGGYQRIAGKSVNVHTTVLIT